MILSPSGPEEEQGEPSPSEPHPPGNGDLTAASVFHDAAARLLDVQISTSDTLDARNASIISISSTVLPLTFGLLALGDREIPRGAEAALIAALVCYILVLLFAWLANSLSRALEYRPHLLRFKSTAGISQGVCCKPGLHRSM